MLTLILIILALVLFGLATFGIPAKVNLTAAGLLCLTLAYLVVTRGL